MTSLISAYGPPSCGKSTLSAQLFYELRSRGINVEYSMEVVKQWCYDGRKIDKFGQYYLFGSESYNQSRFFGSADIVISDSPVALTGYYNYHYSQCKDNSLSEACKGFYKKAEEDGIKVFNFFLPRTRPYNPLGRFQSEEQSDAIAIELREWLDREGYPYIYLDCPDNKRIDIILQHLREAGVLNE